MSILKLCVACYLMPQGYQALRHHSWRKWQSLLDVIAFVIVSTWSPMYDLFIFESSLQLLCFFFLLQLSDFIRGCVRWSVGPSVSPTVCQHFVQKRENGYTAPAQLPRLMLVSVSGLVLLSLIQSFTFKGCSWRPLPAYPRCAEWHTNGIVEFGMSRASVWSALLYIMLFGPNFLRVHFIGSSYRVFKVKCNKKNLCSRHTNRPDDLK